MSVIFLFDEKFCEIFMNYCKVFDKTPYVYTIDIKRKGKCNEKVLFISDFNDKDFDLLNVLEQAMNKLL
jgi:hypothetical protein